MTSVSQRLRRHARGRRTGRPSKNRRCLRWEVPQIDSIRFFGLIFTPEISPVRYIDMKYRLAIYRNLAYRTGLPEIDASLLKYFGTKWSIFTSYDQKFVRSTKRPAAVPAERKGRAVKKVNCFSSFFENSWPSCRFKNAFFKFPCSLAYLLLLQAEIKAAPAEAKKAKVGETEK